VGYRPGSNLYAGIESEFIEDTLDMTLRRSLGHNQALGNLTIGHPRRD